MLKKLLKNQNSFFLYILVGIFCGVLAFFLFWIPFCYFNSISVNPQLSFNIDPINLLSLFVTTLLAMYVLRTLSRKDDIDKVERDLLIGYFDKFDSNFSEEIHKMTTVDGVEGTEVASFFKKYDMYLQELIEITGMHPSKNEENLLNLEVCFSLIRELLTNTPKEGEIEDGIHVNGTRIYYSPRHLGEITRSMGKFKKSIFKLIAGINRF